VSWRTPHSNPVYGRLKKKKQKKGMGAAEATMIRNNAHDNDFRVLISKISDSHLTFLI
jgi:hypothetical protein